MADTLGAFAVFLMMAFFVVVLVKFRAEILNWLNRAPDKYPGERAMKDFDTLVALGIDEKDAIERVRNARLHRKEIQAAIAKEPDAETGE